MPDLNGHLKFSSWNYQIMELEGEPLINELESCTRETIINWLQWNDPNGIYSDHLSLKVDIPDHTDPIQRYQFAAMKVA